MGSTISFSVGATGDGTLTYAWRFNEVPLAGANEATLSVTATLQTVGAYDCVVTNSLNGTAASTVSAPATLELLQAPDQPDITTAAAVLPNSTDHIASTPAQDDVTYAWSVSNGIITSGQGTREITYSAQRLGRIELMLTASNAAGSKIAIENVVVADSLPIDTIFAQPVIHPGTAAQASAPDVAGQTYTWATEEGGVSISATSPLDLLSLAYVVGPNPGSYNLLLASMDEAHHSTNVIRTLSVATNVFLKDPRDTTPRSLHSATLLNDGRVLVVGGDAGIPTLDVPVPEAGPESRVVGSAELFDPTTLTWASVAPIAPRLGHTATLLEDGRVLVVGGADSTTSFLADCYIFDPATQTWSPASSLTQRRAFHSATLLADGRVLVIGGFDVGGALRAAELYDPVADVWTPTPMMSVARVLHATARLRNGEVLVAGGHDGSEELDSSEIYDPSSNEWRAAASLPSKRSGVGAVLLPSNEILVLGEESVLYDPELDAWEPSTPLTDDVETRGIDAMTAMLLSDGRVLATGGIYDPSTRSWKRLDGGQGSYFTTTALRDDRMLWVGGIGRGNGIAVPADYQSLAHTTLFDASNESFVYVRSNAHRGFSTAAARLPDGRVIVTGGDTSRIASRLNATAASTIFDPLSQQWTPVASMGTARSDHTATALSNGQVLVTGGQNSRLGVYGSAERYDPATDTWHATSSMSVRRYRHSSTLLDDGRVLVAGGSDSNSPCSCTTFRSEVDLYDADSDTWEATGALITARYDHTATRLPNGMILVAGGFGGLPDPLHTGGAPLNSVELYDPSTGTWSAAAAMTVARTQHTATLLASGRVLVTGGTDGTTTHASAELYDPATDTWSPAASMAVERHSHSALDLGNGKVLVVGGFNASSSPVFGVAGGELYDPITNTWISSGSMAIPRQKFSAISLGGGRVLIVGGEPNYEGVPEFYE